jgi:RND family efflux transporter MFP subunit
MKNPYYFLPLIGVFCFALNISYAAAGEVNTVNQKISTKNATPHTYASLFPVNKASLSNQMAGVIQRIYFLPGEHFNKGDVLVQFNCEEVDLKADRAQAELEAADAELQSIKELTNLQSASKVELAKAKSAYHIAKAERNIARFYQKKCQIIAPYDGEVVHQSAAENETVKIDDPLIDIVSNQDLEVKMYIPSLWLDKLKIGSPFDLLLDELPNIKLKGKITKIVGQIDPASQSILVYGWVDTKKLKKTVSQKLYSGMSGMAHFTFFTYTVLEPSLSKQLQSIHHKVTTGDLHE